MSVIVKGMEMPNKCCDCDAENCDESFYGDELYHVCSFIYKGYTDEIRNCGRLEECPLHPLPKKHGRLIDGDALMKAFVPRRFTSVMGDAIRILDIWPTIVEAEGDD